jgi:uncharacterized protein
VNRPVVLHYAPGLRNATRPLALFCVSQEFGNGGSMMYNPGCNQGPNMRNTIIVVFASAFLAVGPLWAQTPSPSPASPPPAENVAAARELMATMKATDQFKAILPTIFEGLKPAFVQGRPDMAKDYDAIMPIVINGAMQRLNGFADMLANIYASNFSVDELNDLIAFYKSPTGQKLIERQPTIARASMAAGQQFGQNLVQDLRQQITDELQKREQNK